MLVIDGYNLIHALADRGLLSDSSGRPALDRFTDLLADGGAARDEGGAALVLDGTAGSSPPWARFDAGPPGRGVLRLDAVGPGSDADGFIEALLVYEDGRGRARKITVISSDGRLQNAARGVRSRWMSSQSFAERIAEAARRMPRSSEGKANPASPATTSRPQRLPVLPENWVDAAMEEWRGRLTPDDLDMSKWLRDPPKSR